MAPWVLWASFVLAAVAAVLTYPLDNHLPYGFASWAGGCMFTLLLLDYLARRRLKERTP